jgi:hypothetical protein
LIIFTLSIILSCPSLFFQKKFLMCFIVLFSKKKERKGKCWPYWFKEDCTQRFMWLIWDHKENSKKLKTQRGNGWIQVKSKGGHSGNKFWYELKLHKHLNPSFYNVVRDKTEMMPRITKTISMFAWLSSLSSPTSLHGFRKLPSTLFSNHLIHLTLTLASVASSIRETWSS